MRHIMFSALIALAAVTATAAVPKPKNAALEFVREGTLDLNGKDCSKPVMVQLHHALGHYVRVLLPKDFAGDQALYLTPNTAVRTFVHNGDLAAVDITRGIGDYAAISPIGIQNTKGQTIFLIVAFQGIPQQPTTLDSAYLDAMGVVHFQFPEEAHPQPTSGPIELDTPEDGSFATHATGFSISPDDGGPFTAVVAHDITRAPEDGEDVTIPAGSKISGKVIHLNKQYIHLWARHIILPDGTDLQVNGHSRIPK